MIDLVEKILREKSIPVDITDTQFMVLELIEGKASCSDLASISSLPYGSVKGVIDRLYDKRLLSREKCKTYQPIKYLYSLTSKGFASRDSHEMEL